MAARRHDPAKQADRAALAAERHEGAPEPDTLRPAFDVQRILAMQRTAGNQAVGAELQRMRAAMLQRKVKIAAPGTKADWLAHKSKTPPVPTGFQVPPHTTSEKLFAEAQRWVGDKVTDRREFATDVAFYQAVAASLAPPTTPGSAPVDDRRWAILGRAAKKSGKVTKVPWSTFNSVEAPLLLEELLASTVQVAANAGRSTACHGNVHGKLPKKVGPFGQKTLDQLTAAEQVDKTPYFEMLVAGQGSESGITLSLIHI